VQGMAGTSASLEWHFVNMIYCKNYVMYNRTIILFTLPPIATCFYKSVNFFPHMSKNPQLASFLLAIRRFHLEVVRPNMQWTQMQVHHYYSRRQLLYFLLKWQISHVIFVTF